MKTNLIKRIITIAAAVAVTLAIGAGMASAQGSVPGVPDKGTVRDGNLVWLQNANCFGQQNWKQAMSSAASLKSGSCGLTDGSKAGDWRLPTKYELLHRYANQQGFNNVQGSYWSSSSGDSLSAWFVNMHNGNENFGTKDRTGGVWPVRSGQ